MSEILKTERLTKTYGKSIAVNKVSVTVQLAKGQDNLKITSVSAA